MRLSKIKNRKSSRIISRLTSGRPGRSTGKKGRGLKYTFRNIEKHLSCPDFETPASDDFESCFSDSGTSDFECQCGRINFATESDYWREGQEAEDALKYYVEKHFESPDEYVMHGGYSYVSIARIGGEEIAIGCPCNRLGRYEQFINHNADGILNYLNKKFTRELERKLNKAEAAWKANSARERLSRTEKL